MRTAFVALVVLLTAMGRSHAQELYMPRLVKGAYAAGTRTIDGRPGPKYFQNRSTHHIRVFVSPPNRRITGSEDIQYTNNAPAPLGTVFFRFELNVHAPEAVRLKAIDTRQLASGVQVDEYVENGKTKPWTPEPPAPKGQTVYGIKLDTPVPPGGTATFSFRWHYDLADHTGGDREGAVDATTFFLGYFYPRVAVLDDVNNWDVINHMLAPEFYNDFNDYTVEVTVPRNFVVWGTGDLTNIDQVLQPTHAERLKRSFTSDEIINVASLADMQAKTVTAQNPTNTWRWTASGVPDVAFGISDHYIWDASSVVVDRATGRRASAQAAYDAPSKNFASMVKYIKAALDFAANDLPGVPYPWSKMTIFRGLADQEFPMMANDSAQEEAGLGGHIPGSEMQQFIAAHEILHTYFPFYMGIHERRYAFMEEGWTTAFEYVYNLKTIGKDKTDLLFKAYRVNSWITSIDPGADIPIMTPEDSMMGQNVANNKYGRSALGYLALRDLLGEAVFKKALQEFIARWNGKHPIPWDMFHAFNNATGRDLNWFWKAWFFDYGHIDYAVTSVTSSRSGSVVTLRNVGGFPAPVDVIVTYDDGTSETLHQTPGIWQANVREAKVTVASRKLITSVVLDGGIFMDYHAADNQWGKK